MKLRTLLSFILLLGMLADLPVVAQAPKSTPVPPSPQAPAASESSVTEPPHAMTADDVHAFLDGFVPMQLERENIAGAVVLVVKDGSILFAKGYGYSDVEKKIPVTVDATLFRPGSISKLFTWTAVLQLVEQGKLDLDKDVSAYIDFTIPPKFGKPITLRDLMTHTPGFEEQIKDLITDDATPTETLKQHVSQHIPERIFPPGTTPAYSNYGAALAGYIVERVSGQSFNDYVAEHIFKPLGMTRSTFVQPLPAELKPFMSNGYSVGSGKAKPFEVIEEAPAGALAATAADLSRFMIAHLQNGKFENTQILSPETANQMHSRQFGLSPALNGMCLGFYEETRNGHRIIGHGGDTVYFHSDMHLMDNGVGFFVSYNSAGKGDISPRTALWEHFLDRYVPYTPPKVEKPATADADATAADLSRFMIAHLQNGKFENTQILSPETANQMHSRQFGLSPALNGMCLGFYEETRNGHRIIGHGGDTIYFHSDMHLMLDDGIGFYVSYNSAGKGDISPRTALWEHFLDRYFPYTPPKVEKLSTADADAKAVAGHYLTSRRSESNFMKVANVDDNIQVIPDENGTIRVEPLRDFNGQIKKWQEVAPLVYRSVNGQDLIAFRQLDNNRMQLIPNFPAVVYQRVKLIANSDFNQWLILVAIIILCVTLIFWPVGAIVRLHYHHRLELDPQSLRLRPWVRLVCAIDIAFLLIFFKVVTSGSLATFSSRSDLKFHLIQTLGALGAAGIVVVVLACLSSWRDPHEWFWAKMWNFLLLLACVGFVWFSIHWNLLNFNLNY